MPEPYGGILSPGINEFDYNGTHYESSDSAIPSPGCGRCAFPFRPSWKAPPPRATGTSLCERRSEAPRKPAARSAPNAISG